MSNRFIVIVESGGTGARSTFGIFVWLVRIHWTPNKYSYSSVCKFKKAITSFWLGVLLFISTTLVGLLSSRGCRMAQVDPSWIFTLHHSVCASSLSLLQSSTSQVFFRLRCLPFRLDNMCTPTLLIWDLASDAFITTWARWWFIALWRLNHSMRHLRYISVKSRCIMQRLTNSIPCLVAYFWFSISIIFLLVIVGLSWI